MFEFQEDSTLENGAKKLKEWKDELGKWAQINDRCRLQQLTPGNCDRSNTKNVIKMVLSSDR